MTDPAPPAEDLLALDAQQASEQEAANENTTDTADGAPGQSRPSRRRLATVRILTIAAIVLAVAAALYFRQHIQKLKQFGYAAVFLVGLVSNATVILPVPGLAVSSAMGGVFNPWLVGVAGGVGQAIGELTGYMAGYSGQTWVDRNRAYARLRHWMERYGMLTIFVLSLIPNPVFDLAGITAGALRFPMWKFLLSSIAGKTLKNIAFAMGGYYGIEAISTWIGR
jgi:membrane protein DedA with SNARE-associated domain